MEEMRGPSRFIPQEWGTQAGSSVPSRGFPTYSGIGGLEISEMQGQNENEIKTIVLDLSAHISQQQTTAVVYSVYFSLRQVRPIGVLRRQGLLAGSATILRVLAQWVERCSNPEKLFFNSESGGLAQSLSRRRLGVGEFNKGQESDLDEKEEESAEPETPGLVHRHFY